MTHREMMAALRYVSESMAASTAALDRMTAQWSDLERRVSVLEEDAGIKPATQFCQCPDYPPEVAS